MTCHKFEPFLPRYWWKANVLRLILSDFYRFYNRDKFTGCLCFCYPANCIITQKPCHGTRKWLHYQMKLPNFFLFVFLWILPTSVDIKENSFQTTMKSISVDVQTTKLICQFDELYFLFRSCLCGTTRNKSPPGPAAFPIELIEFVGMQSP